jgi:hypothetical protein
MCFLSLLNEAVSCYAVRRQSAAATELSLVHFGVDSQAVSKTTMKD